MQNSLCSHFWTFQPLPQQNNKKSLMFDLYFCVRQLTHPPPRLPLWPHITSAPPPPRRFRMEKITFIFDFNKCLYFYFIYIYLLLILYYSSFFLISSPFKYLMGLLRATGLERNITTERKIKEGGDQKVAVTQHNGWRGRGLAGAHLHRHRNSAFAGGVK